MSLNGCSSTERSRQIDCPDFDISFSRYRFYVEAIDPLATRTFWGNNLRSLLIEAWKPAVCKVRPGSMAGVCRGCCYNPVFQQGAVTPTDALCSFAQVFEMESAEEGRPQPERPYALLPGSAMSPVISPGSLVCFDLLLVGRVQPYLEEICRVFSRGLGLGVDRTHGRKGRYRLRMVTRLNLDDEDQEIVYTPAGFRGLPEYYDWKEVKFWAQERMEGVEQITLVWLSPLRLRQRPFGRRSKELISPESFGEVFRAILRICTSLAHFYCDQKELDGKAVRHLEDIGQEVETVDGHFTKEACDRKLSESPGEGEAPRRRRQAVEGYGGWGFYQGDLKPFLPWLALGQYLQIGKFRVEGMGAYRLHVQRKGAFSCL